MKLDYQKLEGKQFVIVWKYDDEIWGGTFRIKNNKLFVYDSDMFQETNYVFLENEELIVDIIEQK
jgi:hypothetical protein